MQILAKPIVNIQKFALDAKVKGSLTQDFWLQVFFHKSVSPGPLSIPLGPFKIFLKIRGDIRELLFITGVNDTGEKFISGVIDTSD